MKIKIICFLISTLFICSIFPVTQANGYEVDSESMNTLQYGGYFIFGFMQLINPEESNSEFEVVSFVLLIGNGETIRLNQGEMIQIQGSRFCISMNNFFIGVIGDYSIIG